MKLGLGICGSIAAYRSVDLLKDIKALGWDVECILTSSAKNFVSPLVLETFSGNRVLSSDIFDGTHFGTEHIQTARSVDVFLIYGATANFLAKMALGLADDFLSLQILAFRGPVLVAPAMNPVMWSQSIVQEHVEKLKTRGFKFLGPVEGRVACGETGVGHLVPHSEIIEAVKSLEFNLASSITTSKKLNQKNILISLGPMKTQIDPVRFLQNRSSGKTGFYLGVEARKRGAHLSFLVGPVSDNLLNDLKSLGDVYTYESPESYGKELEKLFPKCDYFLSAAAVLDFEIIPFDKKIEKSVWAEKLEFSVRPVKDFVADLSKIKKAHQKIIAFALQSGAAGEQIQKARDKLLKKSADAILLNSVAEGEGPEALQSHFKFITPNAELLDLGLASKEILAVKIWDSIETLS
jgi:phosphopantothenoylcysteine decarboxylase/phosphopantothenate--cysteine ligase